MAKNYYSTGEHIAITAPGAITSGDVVVIGALLGIAATDAATGDLLAITTEGVYDLPVATAADVSVGDLVYWDAADAELNVDSANPLAGIAVAAAGVGVTQVLVKIG